MPGPATAPSWSTLAAALALLPLSLTGCAAADAAPDVAQELVTPSASATPAADELKAAYEESLLSGDELTTHFLIPAGLGDQELAETFMAKLDEWRNYGATPEFDAWMDADFNDYEGNIAWAASRNAPAITAALMVPDWQTSGETTGGMNPLAEFVPRMEEINEATLSLYTKTSSDSPKDIEPYRRWTTVDTVENEFLGLHTLALGPDERPLRIQYTEYANTDKNRASELSDSLVTAEGHYVTMNVVFKEIDGHAYVRWLSFDSIDMRTEQ